MEQTFIYIDDSKVALLYMTEQFKLTFPKYKLLTFSGGVEAIEYIQKTSALPTMIFCDLIMPQITGADVLDLIKRDSRLHFLPVVMVSAELDQKTQNELEKNGAFHFIPKPFQGPELKIAVDRYLTQALDPTDLRILDEGFAEDTLDQLLQAKPLAACKDENSVKELYRIYHTIKGGARSLQFPSLGIFVHQLESVLTAITKAALYSHPLAVAHIQKANEFLFNQMNRIKEGQVLEAAPERLVEALKLIVSNIDAGWMVSTSAAPSTPAQVNEPVADAPQIQEAQTSSTLRIANQKLDELQQRFKKIQQIRVRMNGFAQELKSEFSDEGFPNQLVNLVAEMEKESMGIMDFFISLRVIPANRLKTFATRTTQQAADLMKKNVQLDFSAEDGLEIDQSIVEVLETALTHLIRNSVDHGIEIPEKRISYGKPDAGQLRVQLIKDSRERFIMRIEDDGAGINAEKLRSIVAKKGMMNEQTLQSLPDEKIYDFIFLDGLSTKQDVSELSGRGVGLSAVKDRILQLGGTIETTSKLGSWTRFEIRMPRVFQL